jgi:CRP-like cAMP-binding protein
MPARKAAAPAKKRAAKPSRRSVRPAATGPAVALKLAAKGRQSPAGKVWQGVRWLRRHSERGLVAAELWCLLWVLRDPETGRIEATRQQIADILGTSRENVSRVIADLATLGVAKRHWERVAGRRGPGIAVYTLIERAKIPEP